MTLMNVGGSTECPEATVGDLYLARSAATGEPGVVVEMTVGGRRLELAFCVDCAAKLRDGCAELLASLKAEPTAGGPG